MSPAWLLPVFGWGLLVGFLLRPALDRLEAAAGYRPGRPTGRFHP